jgi:hypothetical protein
MLAYEIWFYLLLIMSIKILLLLHISWAFPYTTKKLKYVVDRGILWKSEVVLGSPGLLYIKLYGRLQLNETGVLFTYLYFI